MIGFKMSQLRKNQYVYIGLALSLILLFAMFEYSSIRAKNVNSKPVGVALADSSYATKNLFVGGQVFKALIANTEIRQELGLSYRSKIDPKEAMLFVFTKPEDLSFWMKGMLFPLDIIWLDAHKKIIYIEKDLSPETYPDSFGPNEDSLYVIEFAAGTSDHLGLHIGQAVSF